ncbi:MAG: hypothetical protein MJA84_02050, partial [Firmicutes bacterium]|nr:hypothetical protein [Bacillota bacterium]
MEKRIIVITTIFLASFSTFAQWVDNGNSLTTTDNVGIGETYPSDKLVIKKNGGGLDIIHDSNTSYSSIEAFENSTSQGAIQFMGSQYSTSDRRNALEIINRKPSGNIDFYTENSLITPKLRIKGDGNIGIGTLSPLELLEVDGNLFINKENSGFIIDAANNKRVGFMKYSGKEAGIWRASGQDFEIGRVSSTDITEGLGSTPQTDFYISSGGQVGIGTTSMGSHKLAVEGTIGAREINIEATSWSDFVF